MNILGIVTRTHDFGLALLHAGIPTSVFEEERFNREKHTMRFPFGSRELLPQAASDLATGKIVGWFQDRSEMGPRALGNRSILADPRNPTMKDHINARVKQREPFRPFAPAVLLERMSEFFDIEQSDPFMTMAPRVRADKVHLIPAAVHVDGTARIQTIDRHINPLFYDLVEKFAELTGIPLVLNTSFNLKEPIVERPEEAIACYLNTDMDVLVLHDFYVTVRN